VPLGPGVQQAKDSTMEKANKLVAKNMTVQPSCVPNGKIL